MKRPSCGWWSGRLRQGVLGYAGVCGFASFLMFLRSPTLASMPLQLEGPLSPSTGAIASDPSQRERDRLLQLLAQLRSQNYVERQKAFLELWRASPKADALLERLGQDSNLQQSTSLRWLQLLRKMGGEPKEVAEMFSNLELVSSGNYRPLLRMARDHQWAQIVTLLGLVDGDRRGLLVYDTDSCEELLSLAVSDSEWALLPNLVDLLAEEEQRVAIREVWRWLNMGIGSSEPMIEGVLAKCLQKDWDGNLEEAIAFAEGSDRQDIKEFLQQKGFCWKALAEPIRRVPEGMRVSQIDELFTATKNSLYFSWAGEVEASMAWKKVVDEVSENAFGHHELAFCLMTLGEMDRGLQLCEKISPRTAFMAYRLRGDYPSLFRMVGLDPLEGIDFEKWVNEKIAKIRDEDQDSPSFGILAETSQILDRLGYADAAKKLESGLERYAQRSQAEPDSMCELLEQWVEHSRRDRARAYLAGFLDRKSHLRSFERDIRPDFEHLLISVFPGLQGVGCRLLFAIKQGSEGASWLEALECMDRIYHGALPESWDRQRFEDLIWDAFYAHTDDEIPVTQLATVLSQLSRDLGFQNLATSLLQEAPKYPSTMAMIAEIRANLGDFESALKIANAIQKSQERPNDWTLVFRKSQWLDALGRHDEATDLLQSTLCLLTSTDSRKSASESLRDVGMEKEADDLLRLTWNLAVPNDDLLSELSNQLALRFEERDPLFAANLMRVLQISHLSLDQPVGIYPAFQMITKSREKVFDARYLISNGRFEEADDCVKACFRWLPDDIDAALKLVPLAEASGGGEHAEAWYRLYRDHYLAHLEKWPEDSVFHNDLAWLCAKLDRELDLALQHAGIACRLRPNDATYLDTLAEVEFRRGEIDRAIAIAAECLDLDPKNEPHRKQLKRFVEARKARHSKPLP